MRILDKTKILETYELAYTGQVYTASDRSRSCIYLPGIAISKSNIYRDHPPRNT